MVAAALLALRFAAVDVCGPRCRAWGEALGAPRATKRRLEETAEPAEDPEIWLAEARQRQRATLCTPPTSVRCLPTARWIQGLDPRAASLFQVGANIHQATTYAQGDPAPLAVARGWAATLLEPMPDIFAELERFYTPRPPRVELVNAAVCDACGDAPLQMYSIDLTNATGNWGSNDSDARCFAANAGSPTCMPRCQGASHHWTSEIASLDRGHVERHNRLFAYGPNQCRLCAQLLERPMPSNCMHSAVAKNIKATSVRCFCAATELGARLRLRHGNRLSLLVVDAEGHDDAVLLQFPFATVRPARVLFEASHLALRRFYRLARHLRAWGYEMLEGGPKAYISTWHHLNSTEVTKHTTPSTPPTRAAATPPRASPSCLPPASAA